MSNQLNGGYESQSEFRLQRPPKTQLSLTVRINSTRRGRQF